MKIKFNVIAQVVVVILLSTILFFLFKSKDLPIKKSVKKSKKVEVSNSNISGYTDGKLSWQIKADYVWAGRSKFLFRAEGIKTGKLYGPEGKLIVDELQADKIKANSKSKTLSAYSNVSGYFIQTKDRDGESREKKYSKVLADELKYFRFSKRMYLKGKPVIEKKKEKIYSKGDIIVDCKDNTAALEEGFFMNSENIEVSANYMIIYINDDYAEVSQNIVCQRKAEDCLGETEYDQRELSLRAESTYLNCHYLMHSTEDNNDIVKAKGNIKIKQKGKELIAQNAFYNRLEKKFEAWGDVEFSSDSLGWLVDKRKKAGFNNKKMDSAIKEATLITCDRMKFDAKKKELILTGDVNLKQKNHKIKCRRVEFNDKESTIKLIGAVRIENIKEGMVLKCSSFSIDILNESFSADENSEVEFKMEKKKEKEKETQEK